MITYRTIQKAAQAEFVDRRSRFIGQIQPVTSEEEALAFIESVRKKYWDARHHVPAYILRNGDIRRFSDDGEPQGTAGMPTLDTIRKSGVEDAVVVVTRYFGGILLGAGGLVRAYSHGAKIALEAAKIITYEKNSVYSLSCSYSDYQRYIVLLPQFNAIIDDTDFSDKVKVTFALKSTTTSPLIEKIREMSAGKDMPELIGERFDYR